MFIFLKRTEAHAARRKLINNQDILSTPKKSGIWLFEQVQDCINEQYSFQLKLTTRFCLSIRCAQLRLVLTFKMMKTLLLLDVTLTAVSFPRFIMPQNRPLCRGAHHVDIVVTNVDRAKPLTASVNHPHAATVPTTA